MVISPKHERVYAVCTVQTAMWPVSKSLQAHLKGDASCIENK